MKKNLIILGVVFLLLVIAVVVVAVHLDRLVKAGIETAAPGLTQTAVTLEGVSLSLLSGSASLRGLVIGNPSGYSSAQAIRLDKAAVKIEPASLLHEKIIIRSIAVRELEITFEGNPLGENNLKKILDNVNASTAAAASATNAPGAKGAEKKLQVDDLLITGAKVRAQIRTPLLKQDISLALPDIHLTALGQGPEGITSSALAQEILKQVTDATVKLLGDSLAGLGKGLLQDAKKNPGEAVKKVTKGLGDLFKK